MVDITHKNFSLRIAVAQATLVLSSEQTKKTIENNQVPKGDIFEMSRAAGLLAIKKTSELLPDCHPIPIEGAIISYQWDGLSILIDVEVKTIYRTGVEVEAMHGASVVALNMYDMLKPIDKGIEIHKIKLVSKIGGKSDYDLKKYGTIKAAVLVCSDSVVQGNKDDMSGRRVIEKLTELGIAISNYDVVPDEPHQIANKVKEYEKKESQLIIITGGTGLSPRDNTPDALLNIIEKRIPGVEETIRRYGQDRMPYAMLSRSVVGTIGKALVLALPGSTRGVEESMQAIFPQILHVYKVLKGESH